MKIRDGFVSNSSSSSYLIRGVRLPIKDIMDALGNNNNELLHIKEMYAGGAFSQIEEIVGSTEKINIEVISTANYFGYGQKTRDTADVIVGKRGAYLDDGETTEIPSPDANEDAAIEAEIQDWLKIKVGPLSTFIQHISNDNF